MYRGKKGGHPAIGLRIARIVSCQEGTLCCRVPAQASYSRCVLSIRSLTSGGGRGPEAACAAWMRGTKNLDAGSKSWWEDEGACGGSTSCGRDEVDSDGGMAVGGDAVLEDGC